MPVFEEIFVDGSSIDAFYNEGYIYYSDAALPPNTYVVMKDHEAEKSALARYDGHERKLVKLHHGFKTVSHKNKEQLAYLDALYNPDIQCLAVQGPVGSGKTFLALAAALELLDVHYEKIVLAKLPYEIGYHMGALPGELDEKLDAYMTSFWDALAKILGKQGDELRTTIEDLEAWGKLEVLSISHVLGRDLSNAFVIIDEAQLLNRMELRTLLSRAGDKSKVVVCGDKDQVYRREAIGDANGFAKMIEGFRDLDFFAYIELRKVVRSRLAQAAAERLV